MNSGAVTFEKKVLDILENDAILEATTQRVDRAGRRSTNCTATGPLR